MELLDLINSLVEFVVKWSESLTSQQAIMITGSLATLGWIVSASLSRKLSRKQHTMSALLADEDLIQGSEKIRDYVATGTYPIKGSDEYDEWLQGLRKCLNYYEFLCSGILRKDFDEELIKINERYNLLTLYQYAYSYIDENRNKTPQGHKTQDRSRIYLSMETISRRWEKPWMRFP
ncbi:MULTISPECIES: DUF4760 domain-containing protein [Thalassospira]|jgi:hypothetical protein|uniref:DUF4760 domain-containing protein n=1 Tax=Thalassospira profundimaris TaxID=502049 RepID=A0A367VDD0_9PROT|nr:MULTISPECIES: DUF4760 domain-containing protein [Thalassospira]KZB70095.1 hypothetical protein AUQ43_14520 [Thalassospira sp. MCCC 1A01148]RCK23225.1 hypothetical protein TH6_09390 [Thalassospira profundimaris]|tara:strand:+ start:327 stop:857 length:531 start_codon:yes stop_codon:yes gene_type:complete